MILALDCITILFLLVIAWQDFNKREISLVFLILLFGAIITKAFFQLEAGEWLKYFGINFLFIGIQFFILTVYFSVKNKKITAVINKSLGLGDALFFAVMSAAFVPVVFIFFYTLSLSLTLIAYLIWKIISQRTRKEIPLAGSMGVQYIFLISLHYFYPSISQYDDNWIISLFYK
mgnify:CR=1 FL=1